MSSEKKRPGSEERAEHSDNEKSKLPERGDENRKQAPHDRPGKQLGEGDAGRLTGAACFAPAASARRC